ncbi:hypothetical protein L1987_04697 [Smallanthus sonchifolius]|uniref:Uncharacterized protein n=1 Tax=Smallanthus sonchifolius TaxID=185202 RepID=A0ACB9JTN2_9ASTR|nr:hypothetical protein L1987_04697 [Smallanthus sonchifolius]
MSNRNTKHSNHSFFNFFSSSFENFEKTGHQLIKDLNLHPNLDVNIVKSYNRSSYLDQELKVSQSGIVEKRLSLSVLGDSGATVHDLAQHAGYYRIEHTVDARMFYFFFESRKAKTDPVVIWLTGGPGCSSSLALFYEMAFFKAHPDYVNDFYITGESYAGHYIPLLLLELIKGIRTKKIYINLKGFGIGNGLTDPAIQYKAYTDYALANKLISQSDYAQINPQIPDCEEAIKECGTTGTTTCILALETCQEIFEDIAGNINYYDIRKQCEGSLCYDFSNMEDFLSESSVKTALGVPNNIDFVSCSDAVHEAMLNDWMRDLEVGIPALLEQRIELLVYAGEYDLICNWLGNSRWVDAMVWSGQKQFLATSNVSFVVGGKEAGVMKKYGLLTFLKVHDAGHMVPNR